MCGRWMLCAVLAAGVAVGARGQQTGAGGAYAPAASMAGVLRSLAGRAGVVFVGQVQRVTANDGVVEITFSVQQPVLGEVGSKYVMREWAGRWAGGQQRFVVGQRAMFFLHAPNAAGLSSAVEGMAGAVPVIPMGANSQSLLDVRWLATRVARPVGSAMANVESGAIGLKDAVAVVKAGPAVFLPEPVRLPLPVGVAPPTVRRPLDGGPIMVRGGEPVVRHGISVAREATDAQE